MCLVNKESSGLLEHYKGRFFKTNKALGERKMLRKFYSYLMLMTLGAGSLTAASAANYDPMNGQFKVIGEYLYWSPSVDDTYFVIDSPISTTFPNGKRKNVDLGFHSGYRVGGAYLFCDCDREVQVTYTNLDFTHSKTISGDFLWGTVGNADFLFNFEDYTGTASSHNSFYYQNIDAFYAQQLFEGCCLDFSVQVGLEAVELKYNNHITYTNNAVPSAPVVGLVRQHSKTNAIGPKVGFAVGYELFQSSNCACPGTLSLNVLSSGSLLAADTKTTVFNQLSGVTDLDVSDKKSWRVIPALHARVGLNYDMSFDCGDASVEIGYEFTSFIRGLSKLSFPDARAGVTGMSFDNYYNFDMQGLYVSGSFTF